MFISFDESTAQNFCTYIYPACLEVANIPVEVSVRQIIVRNRSLCSRKLNAILSVFCRKTMIVKVL